MDHLFPAWTGSPAFPLVAVWLLCLSGVERAQVWVALLLEMPYGQLGTLNPTGYAALYFDHVSEASPLELRTYQPGELGVVLSRYDDVGDFD